MAPTQDKTTADLYKPDSKHAIDSSRNAIVSASQNTLDSLPKGGCEMKDFAGFLFREDSKTPNVLFTSGCYYPTIRNSDG